jgi:hypothetical protein
MKKDISVDLDLAFIPKQQEQLVAEAVDLDLTFALKQLVQPVAEVVAEQPKPYVNWDEILTEWSYRCPKGYPTVVDGVFTEYEEVKILNEILEERFAVALPLPEAANSFDPKVADLILSSPAFTDLINVQAKKQGTPTRTKVTYLLYTDIKDKDRAAKSDEIVKAFLKKTPKGLNQVAAVTTERERGKKNITIKANGYTYEFILKVYKETGTDTDVKEGFSVLLGYFPDAFDRLDFNTVKDAAKKMKNYLGSNKTNVTGLPTSVVTKMIAFLTKVIGTQDKKALKTYADFLNQSISHGNTFGLFFEKNEDFYIERGDLFNEIRSAGARISGYPADKWCPGDVYFIKNGSEATAIDPILQQIASINKSSPEADRAAAIAKLNSLFSPTYSYKASDKTPIVAVSLKMADAQAGKLKSGLEDYTKVNTDYNLDKTELSYTQEIYIKRIRELQKNIQSYIGQEKQTKFTWKPFDVQQFIKDNPTMGKEALEILRFKYAAYKALYFICTKVAKKPTDVDTALLGLVSFGLGLVESKVGSTYINPPFFKVIANADGTAMAKPQFFKPGSQVSLIPLSGNMKQQPEIVITDSQKFKGLVIDMVVAVGEDVYDISATFRPNGSTQLTIELQKAHLR